MVIYEKNSFKMYLHGHFIYEHGVKTCFHGQTNIQIKYTQQTKDCISLLAKSSIHPQSTYLQLDKPISFNLSTQDTNFYFLDK